jgi:vacuolar-type H+-ATPase subunit I/STV1
MDKLPQKEKFILNVTLTELTFLIFLIFILLFSRKVFSLTKDVDTVNKTNEELSQRLEEANKNYMNSLNQTEIQKRIIDELSKNNDDSFKKLTLQESSVKKCEEFMSQFHEGDMSFTRLFDNEELLSEIKELKEDKSQLESKLKEFEKFDVFENFGDCELALNEAKSREKNLRRRCGNDWPACWSDSEARQEFIYAVTLNENDLTVEGIWPSHRNDDIEFIPNAKALPSNSISLSDFEKNAEPILNWSKEKECRLYVKIIDNTAPTSKEKYKRMKKIVESYFYKFDVR